MFTQLAKLTANAQIKILVTAVSDGKLNLLIEPIGLKGAEKSPITSPLSLTATPEELDAELPAYLTRFSDQTKSLFAQFESQMAQMEEEAKEATEKAKTSTVKKAVTHPPARTATKSAPVQTVAQKAEEQQGDLLELF